MGGKAPLVSRLPLNLGTQVRNLEGLTQFTQCMNERERDYQL